MKTNRKCFSRDWNRRCRIFNFWSIKQVTFAHFTQFYTDARRHIAIVSSSFKCISAHFSYGFPRRSAHTYGRFESNSKWIYLCAILSLQRDLCNVLHSVHCRKNNYAKIVSHSRWHASSLFCLREITLWCILLHARSVKIMSTLLFFYIFSSSIIECQCLHFRFLSIGKLLNKIKRLIESIRIPSTKCDFIQSFKSQSIKQNSAIDYWTSLWTDQLIECEICIWCGIIITVTITSPVKWWLRDSAFACCVRRRSSSSISSFSIYLFKFSAGMKFTEKRDPTQTNRKNK